MYFTNCITLLIVLLASEINTKKDFLCGNGEYLVLSYYRTKQLPINAKSIDTSSIETKWIKQPLDHFDQDEHRMWEMRYFENLEFWKPNSTIYVYIGGLGGIFKPIALTEGTAYDLANETNGAMFLTEHRYYGESIPLDGMELKNLQYLSSRQALADLAYFIKSVKSSPKFKDSTSSKVVVIGGGYSGNLAAWMRLFYPDLVDAAIASSAPVLAKKDFYEYLETVSDDYAQYGQEGCLDKIREIYGRFDRLLKTAEGIKQLKAEENICAHVDMTKPENQQIFFMLTMQDFSDIATYRNPNTIKKHCSQIMNSSLIITTKFAIEDDPNFNNDFCYDCGFLDFIDGVIEDSDSKAFYYQMCTEFGDLKTTNSGNQPFTHNLPAEIYYKICAVLFGQEFNEKKIDEGVKNTNGVYGGLTPNVTHVVFVNGDMDPWSRLGMVKHLHDAPAIVIPRSSHCSILQPKRQDDSDELVKARMYVKNLIKKWLNVSD